MDHQRIDQSARLATFGRRRVAPRACIADSKQHIRIFLKEALEELGFITCECAQVSDLDAVLDTHLPDLVVLGLSEHPQAQAGDRVEEARHQVDGGAEDQAEDADNEERGAVAACRCEDHGRNGDRSRRAA